MSSQTIIKLKNTVTGKKVSFVLSGEFSPSLISKIEQRDRLIRQLNDLDAKKDKLKFAEITDKALKAGTDAMSIILEPEQALENGYDNKRELIEECVENAQVPGVIIDVFYTALSDSTASPEASEIRNKAVAAVEVIKP